MTTIDLLKRPDASILNEAIPVFFIGRNADGLWIARNADGSGGGIFLFKASALRFAKSALLPIPPVTIVVPERFELDVENRANRYAGQLTALTRKLKTAKARAISLARKAARAVLKPVRVLSAALAENRIHCAAQARLTNVSRPRGAWAGRAH